MNVLSWTMRRAVRERKTWITYLMLAICSLILSGGVTRRNVLNLDIMLVNTAYCTKFTTMEEFREWFDLWQFQWLMGAFGQMCLFPIAARTFPENASPEVRIPVSAGYRRGQVWFASLIRYGVQICVLSLMCVLFGAVFSGIRPAVGTSVGYYLRCILLHVWRDLGYAGVALIFVLLPSRRSIGMCLSFGVMLGLAVLSSSGLFTGTWSHVLLARMAQQEKLWLWQISPQVPMAEAMVFSCFPLISFGLASVIGLIRYHADLQ